MSGAATTGGGSVWTRHYPSGVPARLEVPNQLLTEVVEESVRRWGGRTALVYYGAKWTYRQLSLIHI